MHKYKIHITDCLWEHCIFTLVQDLQLKTKSTYSTVQMQWCQKHLGLLISVWNDSY